jgi:translation elongation factor EF-Tu-like GTPase
MKDKMNSSLIIVKAKVRLLTPEEGGRSIGVTSGYRPNHVFQLTKEGETLNTYDGDIVFEGSDIFLPGETKLVTVRFHSPLVKPFLKKGIRWNIYEVPTKVGEGEIIEVEMTNETTSSPYHSKK